MIVPQQFVAENGKTHRGSAYAEENDKNKYSQGALHGITLNNRITGLHFSRKKYGRCDYLHSVENVTPADLNSISFFT